jgi:hypothetical protein
MSYKKSVANLSAQGMVLDTGSGMDLSMQGMYKLQEKCCESVSSRCVLATGKVLRICQLKVCISYKKSIVNLSAQGMVSQTQRLA